MFRTLLVSLLLIAVPLRAASDRTKAALREDLARIEAKAGWAAGTLRFELSIAHENDLKFRCSNNAITIEVRAQESELVSTLYHGIHHLGFLFPHPRWQRSPSLSEARNKCGKNFAWRPAFPVRGFHLHTMHPSEWVKGFLQGEGTIAHDTIRWHVRNRQNAIDVSLLRTNWQVQMESMRAVYEFARDFGILRGISCGAAFHQQKSCKLIPLLKAMTGRRADEALTRSLQKLERELDYDFMVMEMGTSEFTPVNYHRFIHWIDLANEVLRSQGKRLLTKVHVSTNQEHPELGNFNFITRYASKEVGVLPHTVMFYGLYDARAPMYGNENFHHMLTFIREEKSERPVWYYPETSYWIAMDMDAGIFLTDYLRTRAVDMAELHREGIEGHLNFTTGQELGYWLFDWTIALNADTELNFDPLSGLRLLGEDPVIWKQILDFQSAHFKDRQLVAILSFPNLQDELSAKHRIHERNTIKELARSALLREAEILRLEAALNERPDVSGVKLEELRAMLEVTHLRIEHALAVRRSLRFSLGSKGRSIELEAARALRLRAREILGRLILTHNRYPEARIFERKNKNPTSYPFGYLWPAVQLHFWEREESMVRANNFSPFYMNIYNILRILF